MMRLWALAALRAGASQVLVHGATFALVRLRSRRLATSLFEVACALAYGDRPTPKDPR